MVTSLNINPTNNDTFASNNNGDHDIPTLNITTVPEPSSLALPGIGLVGITGFTRLRNKKS